MSAPWTFDEALLRCQESSRRQEAAEQALREASQAAATGEEAYRCSLAKAIVTYHDAGTAWTVAPDLARGDTNVAALRRERDIANGVREAMVQLAWRRSADRKDAQRFADWSMRAQMADGSLATGNEPVYGARRAA